MNKAFLVSIFLLFTCNLKSEIVSLEKLNIPQADISELYSKFPKLKVVPHLSSDIVSLFSALTKNSKPIILKFYADWCAPCKRLNPTLNKIMLEFKDQITIITINTDMYAQICRLFNVRHLPTLLYFKNGDEKHRTNSISKEGLIKILNSLL